MSKYPMQQNALGGKLIYLAAAQELIGNCVRHHGHAILSTSDTSGRPHCTWMGTIDAPSLTRILSVTSPDSHKVLNLMRNPQVEWMFTSEDTSKVVYMRGEVKFIEDPATIIEIMEGPLDLSEAFFLKFGTKGMNFLILETDVLELEYCIPKENVFIRFTMEHIDQYLNLIASRSEKPQPVPCLAGSR